MKKIRAIVLGAGISGIVTAKVLSKHFDEVYLLERGKIPSEPESRKFVPQDRHVHVLLSRGYEILSELFPDTQRLLDENNAQKFECGVNTYWYHHDKWKAQSKTGLISSSQSRPLLEWVLDKQLQEIDNVTIKEGAKVDSLKYLKNKNRITGIEYFENDKRKDLEGDIVVDCTGIGSKSPEWFKQIGLSEPNIDQIPIDLKYVTRYYRKPSNFGEFKVVAIYPNPPTSRKAGIFIPIEDDKILVTISGMLGEHPPVDDEGFVEFTKELDHKGLYNLISKLEPISEPTSFAYYASKWKHYDTMDNFPSGYLVVGDAYCSFNPIYGQGMTSAILQANVIDEILSETDDPLNLHKPFYEKTKEFLSMAWELSTIEDLRYDVLRKDQGLLFGLKQKFANMIIETSDNSKIFKRFIEVQNFDKSKAHLFSPIFIARVLYNSIKPSETIDYDIEDIFLP